MIAHEWYHNPVRKLYLLVFFLTAICIAFPEGVAHSDDLPAFRRGMWEFNRTMEGAGGQGKSQTITSKKCTNPTEDMKRQNEMLSKVGCKFSLITRSGNTFSFTSDCTLQGTSAQGKTVVSVENDSAYTVNIETRQGKQVTKETLSARRIGECP
jgi:hypothetical protein